jgi:hypothetical protein
MVDEAEIRKFGSFLRKDKNDLFYCLENDKRDEIGFNWLEWYELKKSRKIKTRVVQGSSCGCAFSNSIESICVCFIL